ncbi:helicase-exonuclease AddAB subunit AddB [Sporosarcina sp. PTS2304]|uniref:helicase-exonuclease AddAB subunit AddB n=1 Tax=Sporosarcina sp. PTS2304 TaxID=2283194 RepID=UPI000E0CFC30|nr:helicase-exonuclease AddAB subunit AddB [Sporosarcina sp. PTS2304]AXH98493.1 helicase-exonuclease AddAB subunit AddB [Sporosarcina sp. PTS2304]
MSLRFVTGRSGTGKTTFIEREIAEELRERPMGTPIVVIVPDQLSYSMEYSLSVKFGLTGMIRAQVLTFKRLAWRVLQEVGGITREEVDSFGYRMLVRSVLEENKDSFKLFRRAASKHGFAEQISDVMKEFSKYCMDQQSFKELTVQLEDQQAPRILRDKAHDLQLILEKIEEKLGTSYMDSEGQLNMLAEQLEHAEWLQDASVYIDGFGDFTTQEYNIITELMKYTKRVTVVLPMEDQTQSGEHDLFYTAEQQYVTLQQIAYRESIAAEQRVHLTDMQRFSNEELIHLESQFDRYPPVAKQSDGHIQLIEATNRRAEVHAVARSIRKMMREGKRYRGMAVLYRQPDVYDELIQTIFSQYDIPVFISQKKPMLHHPLIEFARSLLEAVRTDWSYEAVFRAVKTDLFFPVAEDKTIWRERADRLENFVLAKGIHGKKRWIDEDRWKVSRYRGLEMIRTVQTDEELATQAEYMETRDIIRGPILELQEKLKAAETGRDVAEALFFTMESLRIYDKIISLQQDEQKENRLQAAAEHEQAWNSWINVLDQFVLMFGDKKLPVAETIKILDEGFDSLEFKLIPPSLDQVTVTTVELFNSMDVEAVFVLGANEGVFPLRNDREGLLTDGDREVFGELGIALAPTSKMQLMRESYMVYRAFTGASERLTVSYPLADEEGKALIPSLYIPRVQQIVEGISLELAVIEPTELPDAEDKTAYIEHPEVALSYAVRVMRQANTQHEIAPEWQAVLAYYKEDPLWSSIIQSIVQPALKRQKTEMLDSHVTAGLYGSSFTTSVSRIESYFSCPFQHFTTYGLGLQERFEFQLEAPDIGDLFHAALKWVSDEVMRQGLSWASLTKEQCWQLGREAIDALTPKFFHRILLSSQRYAYIQRKLMQIIQRTIRALQSQARNSRFTPIAIEAGFGPNEEIAPLEIQLKNGQHMHIRGRIDRVDTMKKDDQTFLRVVDYKSSARALDLTEVYYGLSLQMLTYLDVALEHAKDWLGVYADPAGVLYMYVHNPMLRLTKELTEDDVEKELLKSYKMQGYIVEDAEIALGMDEQLESESLIIPARLKKDGSFYSTSKVVPPEDLNMMRSFVRKRHQQAGDGMLAGDTRVYPYRLKEHMPCTFCSYQSICQFDQTDSTQPARNYAALKPEESLEKMWKEIDPDANSR